MPASKRERANACGSPADDQVRRAELRSGRARGVRSRRTRDARRLLRSAAPDAGHGHFGAEGRPVPRCRRQQWPVRDPRGENAKRRRGGDLRAVSAGGEHPAGQHRRQRSDGEGPHMRDRAERSCGDDVALHPRPGARSCRNQRLARSRFQTRLLAGFGDAGPARRSRTLRPRVRHEGRYRGPRGGLLPRRGRPDRARPSDHFRRDAGRRAIVVSPRCPTCFDASTTRPSG